MENNDIVKNKTEKNRNVFYVGLLSFFGGISQDIFSPILPIYLTSVLDFDKAVVGVAEGVVTASSSIAKIVSGWLSDKFKKQKPIVFAGYFLSMVSRPLLALFTSIGGVVALRLVDGIGKGLKDPAKDVLVAGSSEKKTRGRSFGVARMLDTLGSVVGPIILFFLLWVFQNSSLLYHQILLFSAIPLIITLLVIIYKIKENYKPKGEATNLFAALRLPAGRQGHVSAVLPRKDFVAAHKMPKSFYVFLIIVIIFTLGNSSDAFLILRARGLGFTLLEIPLVIALFNLVYAFAAVPFGSLSDKIGRIPTLVIGWSAFALAYLGFALVTQTIYIWFLYAFYGVYYATSEGVSRALLTDIVHEDHRGRAFGIYGTAVGLATLPASFLAGFLWDKFGAKTPFFFGAFLAAVAAACLLCFSLYLKKSAKVVS